MLWSNKLEILDNEGQKMPMYACLLMFTYCVSMSHWSWQCSVHSEQARLSVRQQLHLSLLLLSHFKAQRILSCFSFLVKAEWEEICTESLEELH